MEADELLIQRAQRGDLEAFEALVRRYEGPLYGFFCRLARDPHLAEDLFQETFLRAFKNRTAFDPGRRFASWLYGIATIAWKDHLRREAKVSPSPQRGEAELRVLDDQAGPAEEVERREIQEVVREEIERLPEDQRLIVILRHYQGFNYEEIGEALRLPLGTVKSRLHYALARLKERLSRKGVLER